MDLTYVPPRTTPKPRPPRITLDNPAFQRSYTRREVRYSPARHSTPKPAETVVTPVQQQTTVPAPVYEPPKMEYVAPPELESLQAEYVQESVYDDGQNYDAPAATMTWEQYYAEHPVGGFEELTAQKSSSAWEFNLPRLQGKNLLYALAAVFLLIGIIGSLMFYRQYRGLRDTVSAASDTSSETVGTASSVVSETAFATGNFTIASANETFPDSSMFASAAYTFKIDRLKVKAPVFPMKLLDNGVLQVPKNIYHVGWYEQSAKPGNEGASFMFGHVNGPTKDGVFAKLSKLAAGDVITITNGGQDITYKVVSTEQKNVADIDMSSMLNSVEPGKKGLNIMTCDDESRFDAQNQTYDGRVIVKAVAL